MGVGALLCLFRGLFTAVTSQASGILGKAGGACQVGEERDLGAPWALLGQAFTQAKCILSISSSCQWVPVEQRLFSGWEMEAGLLGYEISILNHPLLHLCATHPIDFISCFSLNHFLKHF